MHVLVLTPFYPTASDGAQGCFVADPLPALQELGVRSSVMAVRPIYRGRVASNAGVWPAEWIHYPALPGGAGLSTAGLFVYARVLSGVRKLHRQQPIDLIHAHAALPCGHAAALLQRELGIPFVITVHGLDAYSTRQVGGRAGEWSRRVSRWVYSKAQRVICISEKVRDGVLEKPTTPIRTAVVYNGVGAQAFSPAPGPVTSPRLLSVGNLIPIKGHEVLLRAFAAVLSEFPDLSCEVIGDGPERSRLLRFCDELGVADSVTFRGRQTRTEVAEAMRNCSLFALPSRYEALGCVYLEAMATGKPVIACHGQGIDEVIVHGRNGWLIEPDDLAGLKSALSELLRAPKLRREMGEAARQTILHSYTLAHQAQGLVQVYRESAG